MEKKKQTIYAGISLLALALLVVGATYAYFQNQYGESSQTDVKVTTYTTDLLTFETGDAINITADQESFAQGKGNQTGSSFAKAILQANSKTNVATANYYIYLNIESNEFIYTSEDNKAELVLQVTDNSGNPVTSIDGLTYVTTVDGSGTSISGFDITDKSGLINLVNNKEISASPRTEEQYNITLIFVNYNHDQYGNAGYNFNAKLMIQKDEYKQTIANTCKDGQSLDSCIVAMNGIDDKLYYHKSLLNNGAGDNSYRYAGASESVNNYVCFGSDDTTCPADNLYRIIGVFDGRVKLIKADYATSALLGTDGDYEETYSYSTADYKGNLSISDLSSYYWNHNVNNITSNTWSTSLLNKTNLNTNYLNNIGSKWANMIDLFSWQIPKNNINDIVLSTPSVLYQNEIVNPESSTVYEAKIGLMYVSDYGFAAAPSAWTTKLSNYGNSTITSQNWMYMGLHEWTLLSVSSNSYTIFGIDSTLAINDDQKAAWLVRPVFFLSSSIKYATGSGTQSDPIRIKN